jgi:pimeloyl-ACP methyl ester carboxylesterase
MGYCATTTRPLTAHRRSVRMTPPKLITDGPFAETKEVLARYPAGSHQLRNVGHRAQVNGLDMYYEMHGRGRPIVLLHGALTTIDSSFGVVKHALACSRRVIALEQQAHGRTPDIDRAMSQAQMADDTAELLRQLDVGAVDVFGFSMGGATALQLALRHPELVRKMAIVSGGYTTDGYTEENAETMRTLQPLDAAVAPLRDDFLRLGARPEQWVDSVTRAKQLLTCSSGLRDRDLRTIRADTLIVAGETGLVRRAHAEDMRKLLPNASLQVFNCDDHHPSMVRRAAALIPKFLDTRH